MITKIKKPAKHALPSSPAKKKLTVKQQLFVNSYCGDIKEAAAKAGINYCYARQLLTDSNNLHVQEAIHNRTDTLENIKIMSRQQRQEFWTKMALEAEGDGDALRASELLARSEGDFLDRHEHTIKEHLFKEYADMSDEDLMDGMEEFTRGFHVGINQN